MSSAGVRPRSPVLAQFISSFHYHESDLPFAVERILPAARTHIMVNLFEDEFRTYHGRNCADIRQTKGAVLGGPSSEATVIDTREQRRLVSVDFKLGGARPFFSMPVSEASEQLVELGDLWGSQGASLRERLLEARNPPAMFDVLEEVLLEQLVNPQQRDPAIVCAAAVFQRGLAVADVAASLGLLPKTFVRRFRREVGLTPKRFSRVLRLQRVLSSIRDPRVADWSELAVLHGYTDQAHLIHDFQDLTGLTPCAYHPRAPEEHNHVPVTRG